MESLLLELITEAAVLLCFNICHEPVTFDLPLQTLVAVGRTPVGQYK